MMAVLIISISVVALYYMFVQGQVLLEEQYHRRIALERAQGRMEMLKYLESTNPENPGHVPLDARGQGVECLVEPDIFADWVVDVTSSPGGLLLYETVSVTYTWTAPSGREYEVKLVSIY
jgi:hypothetical protein